MRIAGIPVPIGEPIGPDPLDPALHDGRHAEPPERKDENHRVGSLQFCLLGLHIGRLAAMGIGMA